MSAIIQLMTLAVSFGTIFVSLYVIYGTHRDRVARKRRAADPEPDPREYMTDEDREWFDKWTTFPDLVPEAQPARPAKVVDPNVTRIVWQPDTRDESERLLDETFEQMDPYGCVQSGITSIDERLDALERAAKHMSVGSGFLSAITDMSPYVFCTRCGAAERSSSAVGDKCAVCRYIAPWEKKS